MNTLKKIPLQHHTLAFKPDAIHHNYGVQLHYVEKKQQFHYQTAIKYHKTTVSGHRLFSINKQQVYLNDTIPDYKLYEMVNEMTKSLYPVSVFLNKNNQIKGIQHQEIITRCNKAKAKLLHYYSNPMAQEIVARFEQQYSSAYTIARQLQQDAFYQLLFFPLHTYL